MTIYQALQILEYGRSVYFTNLKIDGRFDNERAMASERSSPVFSYHTVSFDEGAVFVSGLEYRHIVIFDEKSGNVLVKEAFTPTQQEREECARYHVCDFWNLEDNQDIPFVRRNKPKWLLAQIADKIDEYIVKNNLPLNDPDEDEDGTCVSSFWLSEALADDPELAAKAYKLRGKKLRELAGLFQERTIYIDPEAEISYGEVFFIDFGLSRDDIQIQIWDGYPK
jgi:hypothetical protein